MPKPKKSCYIALDNITGSHVLLRIVPRIELDKPMGVTLEGPLAYPATPCPILSSTPLRRVSLEDLNSLLMARNAAQFIRACEQIPSLQRRSRPLLDNGLLLSLDQLRHAIEGKGRFQTPDPSAIEREIYLDPSIIGDGPWPFSGQPRYGKKELELYLSQRDLSTLTKELAPMADGESDFVVMVEPLEDYALIRSLVGLSIRLASLYHANPTSPRLLERAGFIEVMPCGMTKNVRSAPSSLSELVTSRSFVVPIGYKPLRTGNGMVSPSPLIREITSSIEEDRQVQILKTCPKIKFAQAVAHRMLGSSEKDLHDHPVAWSYLIIEAEDWPSYAEYLNQALPMELLISSLGSALSSCSLSVMSSPGDVAPCALDALAACWNLFSFHPGRYYFMCEHCGKAMLAEDNGAHKRFCSDSCRAASHNQGRTLKGGKSAVNSWRAAMERHQRDEEGGENGK